MPNIAIWGVGCLGSGLCCFAYPYVQNYLMTITLVLAHGFFIAAYISTLVLSALELFGLEKVTISTGILHCFTGIGSLTIPPVIGRQFEIAGNNAALQGGIRDITHPCFILGSVYLSASLFALLAGLTNKFTCRRRDQAGYAQLNEQ